MLLKHRCSLSRELGPLSVVKMSLEVGAMNRCNQHWCYLNRRKDEETDNFYITIDKILEKHYTIVMGDFNAKVGGQTNTSERAT